MTITRNLHNRKQVFPLHYKVEKYETAFGKYGRGLSITDLAAYESN